jgi:hypothetical protein
MRLHWRTLEASKLPTNFDPPDVSRTGDSAAREARIRNPRTYQFPSFDWYHERVVYRSNCRSLAILLGTLVLFSDISLQTYVPGTAPMAVATFAGTRAAAEVPTGPGLSSEFAQEQTKAAAKVRGKQSLAVLLLTAGLHLPSGGTTLVLSGMASRFDSIRSHLQSGRSPPASPDIRL